MTRAELLVRFRAVAALDPDAPAARDAEGEVGYASLDRASDTIAQALASAGHRRGDRIVLLCGHRIEALVGMLAISKAGGCLVPLSPHEDDELIRTLWREAEPRLALVDPDHVERARALADDPARVIALEIPRRSDAPGAAPALRDEPRIEETAPFVAGIDSGAGDAERLADPDLLAILYTSGSTARAKGVMTTAASIAERTRQYCEASGVAKGERQAMITPWHFAASFPEVWGALVSGAELCLYDARARGVEGLGDWVRAHSIALLQLPVAIARRLLEATPAPALGSVRFASISGDRLARAEARRLLEAMAPGAVLLHAYGATETNLIAACALRLPETDWPRGSQAEFLPVGWPAPGKTIHLLDEAREPAAPGTVGRIAVASERLSPGYWRQPERTAESFGFGPAGERIFLTSDFGRRLPSGRSRSRAGRGAGQGARMRVNLAAVEAVLTARPEIANAAVSIRERAGAEVMLVAHVEPVRGVRLDTSRLRRLLQGAMPAHWMPARFVFVDALPLTANGKLDRQRLPEPGRVRPTLGVDYRAPRDAEEALVCAAWAAEFELDAVGIDDDFFDLGGDSLTLVAMLFSLERETGTAVELAALGAVPTPARVADAIRTARAGSLAGTPESSSASGVAIGAWPERAGRWRALRRSLKQIRKHPFRAGGPILFGRPLAYAAGVRLQTALAHALVRSPFLREPLDVVRAWHARLGLETGLEFALARSVRANTWVDWRLRALAPERARERWVVVEGADVLESAAGSGRGIVLVVTHVAWNALLRALPPLAKRELALIRQPKGDRFGAGSDAITTERAAQLQAAMRLLRSGGVVLIAGDEGHGQARVERPFHGALRRFRPGAAMLAESSGAELVPVFSRLRDDGAVVFRFEAPLRSDAPSSDERIEECTSGYAALYTDAWPSIFDSVTWKSARRALTPPAHW